MPAVPGFGGPFVIGVVGERHRSRVVHHHVHGTEGVDRARGEGVHLGEGANVGSLRDGLAPGTRDRGDGFPERAVVDVGADDPRAAGRALLRDQTSETAPRSGDHDDLAFHVFAHVRCLSAALART